MGVTKLTKPKRQIAPRGDTSNLIGLKCGKVEVVSLEDPPHYSKSNRIIVRYICKCSCGKTMIVSRGRLKTRPPESCPYRRKEN